MTPHDSIRVEFESIGRIVNDAFDGFVEAAGSPRAEAADRERFVKSYSVASTVNEMH